MRKELDLEEGERMGRVLVELMNVVCRVLSFTMEVESQFKNRTIPALDLALCMKPQEDACPKLSIRFFRKPIASKFCGAGDLIESMEQQVRQPVSGGL